LPEKDSVKYYVTNVQLHKNDIVLYRNQFFLLDKESDFPLYATVGTKVIRTKDGFSTEYLYLYLSSKIAYRIRTVLTIPAGDNIRASSRNIEEFPIVIPKEDDSFYAEKFVKVSVPDERLYEKYNITETPKTVEEILKSECIDTIRSNNEELLRNQIEKDLIELNNCFNAGAYKATLMLAGALLETFLIDWVSELDGIDYFEQDFCVTKSNGKKERADLIDYINRLYNEYTPNWNGMSKKAHIIRKKRNLVHVKLCLKRSDEITEEVCREIVDDLKEIIVSRKIMSK
jgi:hypothetical protein